MIYLLVVDYNLKTVS